MTKYELTELNKDLFTIEELCKVLKEKPLKKLYKIDIEILIKNDKYSIDRFQLPKHKEVDKLVEKFFIDISELSKKLERDFGEKEIV